MIGEDVVNFLFPFTFYTCVYQLFIHACSEANVRKFLFCIFPSTFQLLV
jgi:hypothetical protein